MLGPLYSNQETLGNLYLKKFKTRLPITTLVRLIMTQSVAQKFMKVCGSRLHCLDNPLNHQCHHNILRVYQIDSPLIPLLTAL
jgi:UV DNA damage repair endonuclease